MKNHLSDWPILFCVVISFLCGGGMAYADRVTVDGTEYRSARMTEVCREGVIYKTKEDGFVTLPWAELTEAQVKSLKSRKKEALMNSVYHGYYVEGTVFQVDEDGIVVKIKEQDSEPEPYCREGAEILTEGLVMLKGMPEKTPKEIGAEIKVIAYKYETYALGFGDDTKKIPYLTIAKPFWGQEQEWKNTTGQVMVARFLGMKKRICYFEKSRKEFEYPLDKLDAEAKKRAGDYQKKLEGFPFP